jgi:hypothetical protein
VANSSFAPLVLLAYPEVFVNCFLCATEPISVSWSEKLAEARAIPYSFWVENRRGAENPFLMLWSLLRYIADYERSHLHAGEPASLIPWVLKSIDFLSLSKGIFELPDPDCHVVWPISVS